MHPTVIKAYSELGYKLHVGNNNYFPAQLLRADGTPLNTGGGMCVEDITFWSFLSYVWQPSGVYIIGNAFGYSALNIAALFPKAAIDVIDAETEGDDNIEGSMLTRAIAEKHFPNLKLYKGFSPQDLNRARRSGNQQYDACVVDGFHHPEQLKKDFIGMKVFLKDRALVYFHDAGTFNLHAAVEALAEEYRSEGWRYYKLDFVPFGVAILCRNLPDVEAWMKGLLTPSESWKDAPSSDNAVGRVAEREAIIYGGSIYNPTPADASFCPFPEINAFRLALLHCEYKNVVIYGARGRIADILLELLAHNYENINFTFVDKTLANTKINGKWDVIDLDTLLTIDKPNIIITAEISGPAIQETLEKNQINGKIYPLYDLSNPTWKEYTNDYLRRLRDNSKK